MPITMHLPKFALLSVVLLTLAGHLPHAQGTETAAEPDPRPNILLIVADDLGYADLGSFGSSIETPNLDALAGEGVRFTNFHTAVMCAPTRAMLLSGNNNHVAGMARQGRSGVLGRPMAGYENHLSHRVVPFPRLLREAGYHTYITGKWHLGSGDDHSPRKMGFDRSFTVLQGAGNHWDDRGIYPGGSTYRLDGELASWPEGRYSTDLYTEKLIEFIDGNAGDGRPFFAFAAYTSPHWPLQVPPEELDRYAGRYDAGYDALREENFANLKRAGIVPESWTLPPRHDGITPWDELDAEQQRVESREMELYAAMVSNLDHHVGRLLTYLEGKGLRDNTLVVFMSDNGAAAEDFYNDDWWGVLHEHVTSNYENTFETMGHPDSFVSYGDAWAEAGSAPFKRRKTYATEGGMTAPMIVAGPGVAHAGAIDREYLTVMDLAPTFLELAGAAYPEAEGIEPMRGKSLRAFWSGAAEGVHGEDYVTIHAHAGHAMLRRGDWKLLNAEPPFDESKLQLFNLAQDPGETTDLREQEPERFRELLELWRTERAAAGILLPQDL
jgi:arylsulfatase